MVMFSPIPPLFRAGRVAALLVVVACLSPGRVEARCAHPNAIFKTNLLTVETKAESSAQTSQAEESSAPWTPCTGPECSGAPERPAPPLAPGAPAGAHAKEVAQALDVIEPLDGASSSVGNFTSPRPIRRACSVFHPPRSL
jgi:hypothetical protein